MDKPITRTCLLDLLERFFEPDLCEDLERTLELRCLEGLRYCSAGLALPLTDGSLGAWLILIFDATALAIWLIFVFGLCLVAGLMNSFAWVTAVSCLFFTTE